MRKRKHSANTDICDKCGKVLELALKPWPYCPHESTLPRNAGFAPIVIYRDAKGEISFPGRNDTRTPKGCVREEITTIAGYHKLRREMDARGLSISKKQIEDEDRYFSEIESQNRSDLLTRMRSMPEYWRDFAEEAIRHNNSKHRETQRDTGFHMPIFEGQDTV